MAIGTMWNANIIKKCGELREKWNELRVWRISQQLQDTFGCWRWEFSLTSVLKSDGPELFGTHVNDVFLSKTNENSIVKSIEAKCFLQQNRIRCNLHKSPCVYNQNSIKIINFELNGLQFLVKLLMHSSQYPKNITVMV